MDEMMVAWESVERWIDREVNCVPVEKREEARQQLRASGLEVQRDMARDKADRLEREIYWLKNENRKLRRDLAEAEERSERERAT